MKIGGSERRFEAEKPFVKDDVERKIQHPRVHKCLRHESTQESWKQIIIMNLWCSSSSSKSRESLPLIGKMFKNNLLKRWKDAQLTRLCQPELILQFRHMRRFGVFANWGWIKSSRRVYVALRLISLIIGTRIWKGKNRDRSWFGDFREAKPIQRIGLMGQTTL